MGDIQNDTDLKPSEHILDDWLSKHGMAVTFDDAREFLAELREAFGREESAPRPVIDREAVKKLVQDELAVHLAGTPALVHLQMLVGPRAADAVLELARPMPTADQLDKLLRRHTVAAFQPEHSACSCDRKWRAHAEHREHLRDAVLALLTGSES